MEQTSEHFMVKDKDIPSPLFEFTIVVHIFRFFINRDINSNLFRGIQNEEGILCYRIFNMPNTLSFVSAAGTLGSLRKSIGCFEMVSQLKVNSTKSNISEIGSLELSNRYHFVYGKISKDLQRLST